MKLPRIVVSAASSGGGKTSFTLGLIDALGRRGLDVRPFKAGPDYIDPALHAAVRGMPSRNLDLRLMGRAATCACLMRAGKGGDIALIEGVMGYYDGAPAATEDLAHLLGAPAIIALDASACAESAAACALGFLRYRRDSGIVGFFLNNVAGPGHLTTLRRTVEKATGLPVFGFLPHDSGLALPERHLGLVAPGENPEFARIARFLGDAVETHVDLDALLDAARAAPDLPEPERGRQTAHEVHAPAARIAIPAPGEVRIAVARDEAFSFYYEDNFDILREFGCETAFFSPLTDRKLPEGSCGLYLGGGYPELFGEVLEADAGMRESIRSAAAAGMPIYAECGGYLYLLDGFAGPGDVVHKGCGLLPGVSRLGSSPAALGYRNVRTTTASVLGPAGTSLVGHEFHYSRVYGGGPASFSHHSAEDTANEGDVPCGAVAGSVFASFLHLHFAANRGAARHFVAACRDFGRRRGRAVWSP